MRRIIGLLTFFLLVSTPSWATTLYLKSGSVNWTDAASWSITNASGVDNAGPPTASDDCIAELLSGNVTISATSVAKSFSTTAGTGSWGGTLTHNASITWTVSGDIVFNSGMTYTPTATSTVSINLTGTSNLTSATKRFPLLTFNGASTIVLQDDLTFMASKVINFQFTGNQLNLNGKTVSGDSVTNRVLIRSNTLGTSRTITNTSGTFANVDFRDIAFSSNVDYSAITGLSGDAGGNTNSTLTTGATQTATGSSANWSAASWSGRVPLPQDDVVLSLTAGQTLTQDMSRIGKNLSITTAMNFSTNTVPQTIYGGINLTNVATFTTGSNGTWTFEGRNTSYTMTSGGKSWGGAPIILSMLGGTLSLGDAFVQTSSSGLSVGATSTLTTNNFNMTLFSKPLNSSSATFNLGASIITFNRNSSGTACDFSNATVNAGTSLIIISDTTGVNKTFVGAGKTYYDLKINALSTASDSVTITGANTFNRLYTDGGGTKSIILPGSTTTTILSGQGLGNGTNVITFTSSAGSATVAKSGGGTVQWSPVNLTNIIASTPNTWYAGVAPPSVDGGGNTNWRFSNAPSSSSGGFGVGSMILGDMDVINYWDPMT